MCYFFRNISLGLAGMPRRIPDYAIQFADWNMILKYRWFYFWSKPVVILWIVIDTIKGGTGEKVSDEVWEDARKRGLEWTLPSPAPYHTFTTPPTVIPSNHRLVVRKTLVMKVTSVNHVSMTTKRKNILTAVVLIAIALGIYVLAVIQALSR
jgi:heme/copper-type cytochrome/quinol oxidase subunit 1